ncbi:MAG: phosphatase PAP2 family protein [Gammaproteobacteria bacterium]|jgi:membrane-associated phospholipid phosphatase
MQEHVRESFFTARRWTGEHTWAFAPPVLLVAAYVIVWFGGYNVSLFYWLNGLSRYTGDSLWAGLTLFGDALVVFTLVLPFARRAPRLVWAVFITAVIAALWLRGLKFGIDMPRPAAILPPHSMHVIGQHLTRHSFPSGHATTIFALAAIVVFSVRHGGLRALCLLLATLVAFSRCVVGAHWPVDVLMGAAGGWLSGVGGMALAQRWAGAFKAWLHDILTAILFGCAFALYFAYLGYPSVHWLQSLLASLSLLGGAIALVQPLKAALNK